VLHILGGPTLNPNPTLQTLQIYDICVNEFKHRHAWMGFIDADEFLVLRNRKQKLPAFLKVSVSYSKIVQ